MIKTCRECNINFESKANKTVVCDICRKRYCLQCGKVFNSIRYKRKFCSHKCANIFNSINIVWNKGKTKETDARIAKMALSCLGNPNNFKQYWKTHTGKNLEIRICPICNNTFKVSKKSKKIFCSKKCSSISPNKRLINIQNGKKIGGLRENKTRKGFYRVDLNHYFRSTWEANFARILNHFNIEWEYESKNCRFKLENSVYICDFYLPALDMQIEIKGYLYQKSKEKLHQFIKLYPNKAKNTKILDNEEYRKLTQILKDKVENWEK